MSPFDFLYGNQFTPDVIFTTLGEWLDLPDPIDGRRFLEDHPELLTPTSRVIVERVRVSFVSRAHAIQGFVGAGSDEVEEIKKIHDHMDLLHDIYRRGGTVTAIRRAYVDTFGGLVLDIPIWLSRALQEVVTLIAAAMPAQSTNEGIMLFREVIAHASAEPDLVPEIRGELHLTLQEILEEAIDANQREVQEERIACLKAALPVYTLVRYPRHYAHVQHKLGVIYKQRMEGDLQRNLADAAKYFTDALQVYTLDAFPKDYAMNQYNLGNVLSTMHMIRANKEDQELLKEAISCFLNALQVYTRDAFPFEYAKTQHCLGGAYADLVEDRRYTQIERGISFLNHALEVFTLEEYPDNYAEIHSLLGLLHKERVELEQKEALEGAVASCQRALQVYTLARFPVEYAKTNNTLGELYMKRVAETRESNVEHAIACHNRALQVFIRETYPIDYAETQNLLGNAYYERTTGIQRTNLEEAIAYYRRALEVFTSIGDSRGYAKVLNNLGTVYRDRILGGHQENQEQAVTYLQHALQVYTYDQFPEDYALVQNNLGTTYLARIQGERYGNLEEAIHCFHRALQVYTLERFPKDYAEVQHNLGNAYRERLEGIRRDNIEEAINCYRYALQVFTIEDFPIKHGKTQNQLGIAYRERIADERRDNLEEAINCFNRALQIFTLEAFPIDYARAQGGLGNVYKERVAGMQRENMEVAIIHYTLALQVYTLEAFPLDYAKTLDNLGVIYSHRIEGERSANLEQALECHTRALEVLTREDFPMEYAGAQNNLSITYVHRVEGERRANLEQAIACHKHALQVFTREAFPIDHAITLSNLGAVYMGRIEEEQRFNLELAIDYYEKALEIATFETFPMHYAQIQSNLGTAYRDRVMGEQWENLECSIARYEAALHVLTFEAFPIDYARTQNNLGAAYMERILGERGENQERAIAHFMRALVAHAVDPSSLYFATAQSNLGVAFERRIKGDRGTNLEQAIDCYKQALQVYRPDTFPQDYARVQNNLGVAYIQRIAGEKQANLEEAIACFKGTLQVYRLSALPRKHRDTQLNMAFAQAMQQNWQSAHEAYNGACAAEDLLVALGAGVIGRSVILKEGGDPAINNGFVLVRLSRIPEAAASIERGRARGLAESMALDGASPILIRNGERRARYEEARKNLIDAQAALNAPFTRYDDLDIASFTDLVPRTVEQINRDTDLRLTSAYHRAKAAFDGIVDEIREAEDPPDFLKITVDDVTILRAAEQCGQGHAIIDLAATSWGGVAVAALGANPSLHTESHFTSFDLPALTAALVDSLLEVQTIDGTSRLIGGFAHAQVGDGFKCLLSDWTGATIRERADALHAACEAATLKGSLDAATQEVLKNPLLSNLADQPIDELSIPDQAILANKLGEVFLKQELQRCLEILAEAALRPIITWMYEQGATSLTLVPCGRLAAFPLAAMTARLAYEQTVDKILPTSIAPSARSLLRDKQNQKSIHRTGVYAVGNPYPTPLELWWSKAEAYTLVELASRLGLTTEARVQQEARRQWLIEAFHRGYLVDASCHGRFDTSDFLRSALLLAGEEQVTLADMLSHQADLRGLHLLILSACQTAILDLTGATEEVHSLAVGMVQAGARAVLASLWAVNDLATYLLIVRFAQEWLPTMDRESPAAALVRAQRWLRTVRNRDLQSWCAVHFPSWVEEQDRHTEDSGPLDEMSKIEALVRKMASRRNDPDACFYADPIYWAGFQITGW